MAGFAYAAVDLLRFFGLCIAAIVLAVLLAFESAWRAARERLRGERYVENSSTIQNRAGSRHSPPCRDDLDRRFHRRVG